MSPMSAEAPWYATISTGCCRSPWNKKSKIKTDLDAAEKILDDDHYGLEKVKERIVEYLAVQQRADS